MRARRAPRGGRRRGRGGGVEGGQEEGQLWQVRRSAQGLQGALVGAQQQVDECGVRRGRWQWCILHAEHRQWQERDGREAGRRELKPARTAVQQQPPCGPLDPAHPQSRVVQPRLRAPSGSTARRRGPRRRAAAAAARATGQQLPGQQPRGHHVPVHSGVGPDF